MEKNLLKLVERVLSEEDALQNSSLEEIMERMKKFIGRNKGINFSQDIRDIFRQSMKQFSDNHYIGRWIIRAKEDLGEEFRCKNKWQDFTDFGQYFTRKGEATNYYMIRTKSIEEKNCYNHDGTWNETFTSDEGICFETNKPAIIEKIKLVSKQNKIRIDTGSFQISEYLDVFDYKVIKDCARDVIYTFKNHSNGPEPAIWNIGLGINTEGLNELINKLIREK